MQSLCVWMVERELDPTNCPGQNRGKPTTWLALRLIHSVGGSLPNSPYFMKK
jgi:hypothetical protein